METVSTLEQKTVVQLKAICKKSKISIPAKARKADIIKAILDSQGSKSSSTRQVSPSSSTPKRDEAEIALALKSYNDNAIRMQKGEKRLGLLELRYNAHLKRIKDLNAKKHLHNNVLWAQTLEMYTSRLPWYNRLIREGKQNVQIAKKGVEDAEKILKKWKEPIPPLPQLPPTPPPKEPTPPPPKPKKRGVLKTVMGWFGRKNSS
jgi:hypothetical protein